MSCTLGVRFRDKQIWEDGAAPSLFGDVARGVPGPALRLPAAQRCRSPEAAPAATDRAARSRPSSTRAAGLGALGFQFVSAEAAEAWVHAYYNAITNGLDRLCDYSVNPNIALVSMFMCAPTDEERRPAPTGPPSSSSACYNSADRRRPDPGEVNMWDEYSA